MSLSQPVALSFPFPFHVERTDDPGELRWVIRHPALMQISAATAGLRMPPAGSPLAAFLNQKTIRSVWVGPSEVRIRAEADRWPAIAAEVEAAIIETLSSSTDWCSPMDRAADECGDDIQPSEITLAEVQDLIDRGAGELAALHGGRIEVSAVGQRSITVRLLGACNGCSLSGQTIEQAIRPKLQQTYPWLSEVVIDRSPSDTSAKRRLVSFLGRKPTN